MADTDAGSSKAESSGAESSDAGSSGTGTGTGVPDGDLPAWKRAGTNGPATLREVARIAEQQGFGETHLEHAMGGGDVGCVGFALGFLMLIPGIGILLGPYGTVATSIAITCLVLVVAIPVAAFRYETRRENRIPHLHILDGGIIITYPHGIVAYPWREIRLVERSYSVTYGQGGAQQRVHRLEMREIISGDVLTSTGSLSDKAVIRGLAEAGGARMP